MKKDNSLGEAEFLLEHFFWLIIGWIWYRNILFRCLPSCSLRDSKRILAGIVVFFCVVGIAAEIKKNRNGMSIFFNLIWGYGIYTVLACFQAGKTFIMICLLLAGVLSAGYTVFVMSRKIRIKRHTKRVLCRRAVRSAAVTQRIMGLGFALIIAASGVNVLFDSIITARVSPVSQSGVNEQALSNSMETIVLLQREKWESLTAGERLNVLQTVANIEQNYLGISNELNVGVKNLREGLMGYYSDRTHEIVVDRDSLLDDSSWEVLDTVFHEAFHSYQYRMIEALDGADESSRNLRMFRSAKAYAEEFDNYQDGEEDFCSYYYQACELDARDFAENEVKYYQQCINEYIADRGE